ERHQGRPFPARREATERKLFANEATGAREAPWIWPHCEYEFTLHNASSAGPIAAARVHGRREIKPAARYGQKADLRGKGRQGPRESVAMVTAAPNPVPISDSHGTTELRWDTGDGSPGWMFVSVIWWAFDQAVVSSDAAVASLQAAKEDGAQFLAVPQTAFWWLRIYPEFKQHLEQNFRCAWSDEWCVIYELSEADRPQRP